jgi:hypothetical protein
MTTFSKGDKVTVIGDWDRSGTVWFTQGIVYSCGKRRMIVTDERTGEQLGKEFHVNFEGKSLNDYSPLVLPRLEGDALQDKAVELAGGVIAWWRNLYRNRLEKYRLNGDEQGVEIMEEQLELLHEPRVIHRV